MSKNNIIIALVVLCFLGIIWGSVQNKKSSSMERQLIAMRGEAPAATADAHAVVGDKGEGKALTAENQELHSQAASLKGSVDSQKEEIAALKKELAECGGSPATEEMQAQLDKQSAAMATLEESLAAAKAELETKSAALAAATEASAGCDELKSSLANSVDTYSAKSQELATEVEECNLRIATLDKALDERTKLLVGAGEELARTKLNMNVLLSKIGAQNNALEILEETRVALEKELAMRPVIENDDSVVEEVVVVGEVEGESDAEPEEAPAK